MSVNLLVVAGNVGAGVGAAFWGWISDRVGRKPCMLVCTVGGMTSYVFMYAAGVWWGSYYAYMAGQAPVHSPPPTSNHYTQPDAHPPTIGMNQQKQRIHGLGGLPQPATFTPFLSFLPNPQATSYYVHIGTASHLVPTHPRYPILTRIQMLILPNTLSKASSYHSYVTGRALTSSLTETFQIMAGRLNSHSDFLPHYSHNLLPPAPDLSIPTPPRQVAPVPHPAKNETS